MTNEEVMQLMTDMGLHEGGMDDWVFDNAWVMFANAVASAEREKVAAWMMQCGYATGHGDTIEDLLKELDWQAKEIERSACAKICEEHSTWTGRMCAETIKARG